MERRQYLMDKHRQGGLSMAAQLLDGKAMSEELRADIARKVSALK